MTEHQSKKHDVESTQQATRVAQERLEQELFGAQLGVVQAMNSPSLVDGLVPLRSPEFQAAQRSQIAFALQQRHGNRYVHRAIAEGDTRVAPRPGLAGTIARWPPDNPADIPRFLTDGRQRLLERLILRVPMVMAQLAQPHQATDTLRLMLQASNSAYYDLPDEIVAQIDRSGTWIQDAYFAMQAISSGGSSIHDRLTDAISHATIYGTPSFSSTEYSGRWESEVIERLRNVDAIVIGDTPDYRAAFELCEAAIIMANRLPRDASRDGEQMTEDQYRNIRSVIRYMENAESGLRVFMQAPPSVATPAEMGSMGPSGAHIRFALVQGQERAMAAVRMITRMLGEGAGAGAGAAVDVGGPIEAPAGELGAEAGVGPGPSTREGPVTGFGGEEPAGEGSVMDFSEE